MAIQFPQLKKSPNTPNATVSMTSPYTAPTANIERYDAEADGQYNDSKFYSPTGRIGRIKYLLYPMGFMLCALLIFGLAMTALGGFSALVGADGKASGLPMSLIILSLLLILALLYINITSAVRRLNDLNRTGWLALLLFVPVISNFFPLYLIFAPGDKGRNDYGLPAEPPKTWMKVLAILMFGGAIVAGIGAAIAIPAYQQYIQKAQAAKIQANATQTRPVNPSASPSATQTAEPASPTNPSNEAMPTTGAMPATVGEPSQSGSIEKPLMVENTQGNATPSNEATNNSGANFAQTTTETAPSDKSKSGNISYEEFTKLSEGKVYHDPVHVKK